MDKFNLALPSGTPTPVPQPTQSNPFAQHEAKQASLWSVEAATMRAKMAVYLDHGFTREEAFKICMRDAT